MVLPLTSALSDDNMRCTKKLVIIFLVATSTSGACFFEDLGVLNVLNGALSTLFFIALFPLVIGQCLCDKQKIDSRIKYFLCPLGLLSTVLGIIYTDNNAEGLVRQCA